MIGAGAAMALGLVFGMWARPNLDTQDTDAAERAAAAVPLEVSRPPPQPPVVSHGKLEVLPPDVAAANRRRPEFDLPPPPPLPEVVESRPTAPPRVAMLTPPPQPRPQPTVVAPDAGPAPQLRAGFDCAAASGVAEQMICSDPALASADRELSRAYRRALNAGVPAGPLRADQRDWMAIREDAARHSRRALGQVYEQRIEELNAAADESGPSGPGY